VLTGETGAGKSIIVGALSLLRGARGKGELVREGMEAAIVDAQFEPETRSVDRIVRLLEDHGLPGDEPDSLVMQRIVPRTGRGRSFVQGSLTTAAVLGHVGEELIDICSQHEHHFLTHTARHLDVLDAYAGLHDERSHYAELYAAWREARSQLQALRARISEGAGRADYLRFQIDEIDRIAPEAGEYEMLRRKVALMRGARRWLEFAQEAHQELYEADDAIASRLSTLSERARAGAEDSDALGAIHEQLVAAQVACEEAAQLCARFGAELDLDPMELERSEDRLHELESLRRKHDVEPDALVERVALMRDELETIEHADQHLDALQARVDELEAKARDAAGKLHTRRRAAAKGLARDVEGELRALHIRAAKIEVAVERHADNELGPHGLDAVEFLFCANEGEPLAPLRKVASGGELSRVLLALKGVLAAGDRVATYVFDEVDAGVGGAVAEAIGRRLKQAARRHQVLCITHLPQIAAFADAHFRVEKAKTKGRTVTRVVQLSAEERIEELARMLGGRTITKSAREHARELLSSSSSAVRARP
jgi:DNA repair protein RecN (Recombination protein N)